MNTIARARNAERAEIIRQANSLWRRAGVRGADRRVLLAELETELRGENRDGHDLPLVLDAASEGGMCGRALRLELAVPAAVFGLVTGLATPLLVLLAVLSPLSTINVGQYERLLHISSGVLGYLGALLFVSRVFHNLGDPRAQSTVRWLAVLLPIGAALSGGAAVAILGATSFFTSWTAYIVGLAVIVGVAIFGIGLTVGIARFLAVRRP